MLDKFKRFLKKPVYIVLDQEITLVMLMDSDYKSPSSNRTFKLAEFMARVGGDKIQVVCLHKGDRPYVKPYPDVNLMVANLGSDLRKVFRGRTVMWTDAPEYASTLQTAHPNLIVYDDREKGISDAQDQAMYDLADLVFSFDPGTQVHPTASFIPSSTQGAIKALQLIQQMPNRKPPRQ